MADSTSSNREVAKSTFPVQAVDISENSKSVVQLGRTNVLKDSAQETINVSDTSKREVAGSPLPVGISENSESVVQPDSTCNSLEDLTEEEKQEAISLLRQIFNDNGKFVKDRRGRFRVVYNDDDNIDEYKTCSNRVKINAVGYNNEFREAIHQFLKGIAIQKEKRYPYTVIRINDKHKSITPSKSNRYREGSEYKECTLDKDTPLYKHLKENSAVRLVRDLFTGFTHICKTNIMSKFRCDEVQAMLTLDKIAPEIYVANKDEDNVSLHMELIEGKRLDIVAMNMKKRHMWPLCLHIFNDILYAINKLMFHDLSHCDIYTKNIIIEVVEEGQFRIRLIDYGDACGYTINNLINDMRSLVATLLALFTKNHFDVFNVDPDEWIEKNYERFEKHPKLWVIFKRALDVKNGESLKQFINYVGDLLVDNSKKPDFNKRLEEIAKLLKE